MIIDIGSPQPVTLDEIPFGSVFTIPEGADWRLESEGVAYMVTDEQSDADPGCVQVVDLSSGGLIQSMRGSTKVTFYGGATLALHGLSEDED